MKGNKEVIEERREEFGKIYEELFGVPLSFQEDIEEVEGIVYCVYGVKIGKR